MLKKIGIVLVVVVLVAIALAGFFFIRIQFMASTIKSQCEIISPINLAKVADGVYEGSFGDFVVSAKVAVTVKNHRIAQIKILDQSCGPGYEALDTVNRILKAQTPKVDAVTGASSSSRSIMIAINRALTGK